MITVLCSRSQTTGSVITFCVILQTDQGRRLRAIGAVGEERQAERPQQREDVHHEQQRQRRRHQQAAGVAAPGVDDQRDRQQRSAAERADTQKDSAGGSVAIASAMPTMNKTRAAGQLSQRSCDQPIKQAVVRS